MSDRSKLTEINIRSLGVIEEASLQLGEGFTVFSGETGAGKTMVLTALGLVLGGKVDPALVRQGKERLVASASFSVGREIEELALERGAAVEDHELIFTRTLNVDGKSKASAGGVSVPTGVLAGLGESLVEIHGQAASANLSKASRQREMLDNFAGSEIEAIFQGFQEALAAYQELKKRIGALKASAAGREAEVKSLREFSSAFKKVQPKTGELTLLEQEILRLSSVESLRMGVGQAAEELDRDEGGVLQNLGSTKRALESVSQSDPLIAEILEAVSESFYLLTEANHAVIKYLADLDMDPAKLDAAQQRKSELNALLKRFGDGTDPDQAVAQMLIRWESVEERIGDLTGGEERIAQMEGELSLLLETLRSQSMKLSKSRKAYSEELSKLVTNEIHMLSMPHTQFICSVLSPDYTKPLRESEISAHGCDEISMGLQMQADGPLLPISKAASGGELSRIMLALEVVLAQSAPVGTYIFDEVDAGVGGKAAIEVGRRLFELSRHAQVIVVTHLPQVAAWADSHFVLEKNEDGAVNQSSVKQVQGEERIVEIARMLAGHESSQSAREHAAELLAMRVSQPSR